MNCWLQEVTKVEFELEEKQKATCLKYGVYDVYVFMENVSYTDLDNDYMPVKNNIVLKIFNSVSDCRCISEKQTPRQEL